jgi:hypothetical protein
MSSESFEVTVRFSIVNAVSAVLQSASAASRWIWASCNFDYSGVKQRLRTTLDVQYIEADTSNYSTCNCVNDAVFDSHRHALSDHSYNLLVALYELLHRACRDSAWIRSDRRFQLGVRFKY